MSNNNKPRYRGFVRYLVDEAIKKQVKANKMPIEQLFLAFMPVIQEGHKLSIHHDSDSETYTAMLYGNVRGHSHAGLGLSGRHSDFEKALKLLYEVHFTVFNQEWPTDIENQLDQYDW